MSNTRSPNFRYIHVNAINLQFNGSEMMLRLGINEDFGQSPSGDFLEEVGLIMSGVSAKLIGETLTKVIQSYEKASGVFIPLPEENADIIRNAIQEAEQNSAKQAELPKTKPS